MVESWRVAVLSIFFLFNLPHKLDGEYLFIQDYADAKDDIGKRTL